MLNADRGTVWPGLNAIVESIKKKGRNKPYDCLLGISGGVDSSFVAHKLKLLGLRTLLVHMDNGWNSSESANNIEKLASALGFDYQSYVLDWEEFRDLQLSFLKANVIEAETPTDMAISGALHKLAAKYKISYIISGCNMGSEGILPKHWHYDSTDAKFLNAVQEKYGTRKLKTFPIFGYREQMYYKLVKGIRVIYLLNYFSFRKEEAEQLIAEKYGWKSYGGKHHESRYTKFIQSFLLPVKFNLDYRKATYSSLICAGQMTRQKALELLQTPPYKQAELQGQKDYIAKKLQIDAAELEEIIKGQPTTYRSYPNDEKWLNIVYNTYRKFFRNLLDPLKTITK